MRSLISVVATRSIPAEKLRGGFALIELLITLFIIGLLLQIFLPALQAVRETARAASCQHNLKQIVFAIQGYEESHETLPVGAYGYDRGTWMAAVLPWSDGEIPEDKYRWGSTRYDAVVNVPITSNSYSDFQCPADEIRSHVHPKMDWATRRVSKHSYVANFGNTGLLDILSNDGVNDHVTAIKIEQEVKHAGAPFYQEHGGETPAEPVRIADITDGIGKTLFISETIQAKGKDIRGLIWFGNSCLFITYDGPNSTSKDILPKVAGYCVKNPANPPCRYRWKGGTALPMRLAARSRHPGGVNASFGDASARFISDDIEQDIWRAMSTTQGGEEME